MIGYPKNQEPEVKKDDLLILILDELNRKSSLGVKVVSVDQYKELEEPTIIIDSRIAGDIAENNYVKGIVINAPKANYLEVIIPDNSGIYEGDWSTTIRPQLLGKICDIGNPIRFSTPTKDGKDDAVDLTEGIINRTIPSPPVKIGQETVIRVFKRSQETINNIKVAALQEKNNRATSYLEELEQKVFELLRELKNGQLEPYSRPYSFKTKPKEFYESLKNLFEQSYILYNEGVYTGEKNDSFEGSAPTTDQQETVFSGTVTFFTKKKGQPDKIIEAQVTGQEGKTKIILTVYAKNKVASMTFLEEQLHNKLFTIGEGMEIETETVAEQCSCGTILDITKANEEGWIKCPSCGLPNRIPVKYRNINLE
ncbi:MAG: hypothetical protein GF308_05520 [Candidatus Heimdallarchaeota archaeon]|nr:hypothetical protein [Candidatus Heimdallarchaeota archaeon]